MRILTQILSALLISIVGFVVALFIFTSQRNTADISTYNIVDDGGTKHHGIIQIINDKGNIKYSTCSAFVVNKHVAITAAHCISFTESERAYYDKTVIAKSKADELKLKTLIRSLYKQCSGSDYECMTKLRYARNLLNKELRARKRIQSIPVDTFSVLNIRGENTGIKATAEFKHDKRDYGIIRGDFSNFNIMLITPQWRVKRGDVLRTCGFFGGKTPPTCTDFTAETNSGFSYTGQGMLLPGVSGGPVIDHFGHVVGITESAGDGYVSITPILGILNLK